VDGTNSKTLSTQTISGALHLMIGGQSVPVNNPGGTLGAGLDALNTDIPAAKSQLDDMAAAIVTTVNTIHRTGWTQAGDALGGANWNAGTPPTGSNVDFFDPTHTTAASISLSSAVASDASYIASGDVQNGTGNNNVANALAGLRDNTSSILKYGSPTQTTSIGEYYRDLVTRLGVATNDADASATVFETTTQQASLQRQSVSGVSTDDELVELTKRQQAYSAAARVITVASDMSQTLLDLIN
jgi:flagellar hook-associated protein 1 FlgK